MLLRWSLWLLLTVGALANPRADKYFQEWCQRHAVVQGVLILVDRKASPQYCFFGPGTTATTPFLLASLSKSFTALAVARLAAEGKLALEDPFEGFTARALLSHTSGLPRQAGERRYTGSLAAALKDLPAPGPAGRHEYSNANYLVLGALLEHVTGQSYAEVIRTQIFQPLGMNLSEVGSLRGRPLETVCFQPSGGLVSVPEDMALYLQYQLAQSARLQLHQELVKGSQYGYGWYCDHGAWANHSGDYHSAREDYQSFMALHPKAGKGFVVLTRRKAGQSVPLWHDLESQLWGVL